MRGLKVEDVMTTLVVKLYATDTIHEAAAKLAQNNISGAPVVADGKVIGIVSEADLMAAAIPPAHIAKSGPTMSLVGAFLHGHVTKPVENAMVSSVMSDYVVTIAPEATVWDAAALMERRGVKRLPVTDQDNTLLGIISRSDLVAIMARPDKQLRADVVEAIGVLGETAVSGVRVQVENGVAFLRGSTDRRTTKDIVCRIAARTPGIVEVVDRLEYEWDDTKAIPHQRDPWAVGPLVKGA